MCNPSWLPDLISLDTYGGDWTAYLEVVYEVFRQDLIGVAPTFRGEPVKAGTQLIDGKLRTFWHLVSEGDVEVTRTPDLRRCERISWVRAIIDHDGDPAVMSWPNVRGGKSRQVLWLKQLDFAVILEKRTDCWWLWTAYQTTLGRHRKFEKEYDEWIKSRRRP